LSAIAITTTQNVAIEYETASVSDRILAALLDVLILAGYVIGMSILFFGVFEARGRFGLALSVILYLPVFLYDLICELSMDGQSIGKRQMKIKVIRLDGAQPNLGNYFLRWLFRFIDVSCSMGGIAILTLMINGKGQRLGDIAAGTTVIKIKPQATLADTILTQLEENYRPVFAQAAQLSDQDLGIVKEVLDAMAANPDLDDHLVNKAKTAIAAKIGVETEMNPRLFLRTVLKDYNYYHGKV